MKYILFTLLFFLTPSVLLSQNYADVHLQVHEITVNTIEAQKNYELANTLFLELFKKWDYRFSDGIREALFNRICNMNGTWGKDSMDIDFYLRKFVLTNIPRDWILRLTKCTDSTTVSTISQKIYFYDSIAELKLNQKLVNLIDSIYTEDQRVRMYEVSNEELWRTDSLNLLVLKELMTKYGRLLGVRDLGKSVNKYEMLIIHLEPEMILNTWYDKILESVYKGDLYSVSMAYAIDYALFKDMEIIDGKPAVRYSRYGQADFGNLCVPVKNIEETDQLRKRIGLPPLEYRLKKDELIYDVDKFKTIFQLIEE